MFHRPSFRMLAGFLLGASLLGAVAPLSAEETDAAPVPLVTGRFITPEGTHVGVGNFPANLVLSPDGKHLICTNVGPRQSLTVLRVADGSIASKLDFNEKLPDGRKEGLYYGLCFGEDEAGAPVLFASRGTQDMVSRFRLGEDGALSALDGAALLSPAPAPGKANANTIAGIATSGDGRLLYAVNNNTTRASDMKGSLSVIEIATGALVRKIPLAGFPYAIAVAKSHDGRDKLYVTSERDSMVQVVDPGGAPGAEPAVEGKVLKDVHTGMHPVALLLDRAGERLFVANAGGDLVSILSVAEDRVTDNILVRPDDARGLPGATPLSLAFSPDEKTLYVALADMNAVAVVDLAARAVAGYVPAGWYPTSVAVAPDGSALFVASAKGIRERTPNDEPQGPDGEWGRYILSVLEGTVSRVPMPDAAALRRMTAQTLENNFTATGAAPKDAPLMENPGIEHVVYVIKENRTYDQVLGDLPQGAGDPDLCLFPREVTPNQHAIAERFVLLDNFYVCAEVSADGWNWSTSGMLSEYTARNTEYNYAGRGRLYDFEGQNNGVAVDLLGIPDVAAAPGGYIWDHCLAHRVDFRNYGFFTAYADSDVLPEGSREGMPKLNQPTKRSLEGRTDPNFMLYSMDYADSDAWVTYDCPAPRQRKTYGEHGARSRIEAFRREFDEYEKNGNLPKFLMVRLPRDHTAGTREGDFTPRAMVADNDYAVGQLVEMFARSQYWKKTAIFILEDDSQAGYDHVDAHRSIAFVISPFVEKGSIDGRFYNTDSMLRTMMELLGMPPMNQLVAVAPLMRVFGDAPGNDAPYEAILPPREIVSEVNKKTAYRSADCEEFDFVNADAAPDADMNEIVWRATRGHDAPLPPVRYGMRLFAGRDDDD